MKRQTLLIITLLCLTTTIAENPLELEIPKGKSNFTVSEYFPSIYPSEIIHENPQIKSISINSHGRTFGYLNALGGIGTNFLIEPNKEYEIYSNESITIKLKD